MDLQQFLSRPSGSFSGAFQSRHFNQNLSNEVRELAHRGLKLFPVSLAAKLAGDPDRLIADAIDDILLLQELSAAAQPPLWGHRLALGPSGLALPWENIHFDTLSMLVDRAVVHGRLQRVKTEYSEDELRLIRISRPCFSSGSGVRRARNWCSSARPPAATSMPPRRSRITFVQQAGV